MVLKFEDDSLEEVRPLHCPANVQCAAHMHALQAVSCEVYAGLWTVPEHHCLPHRHTIQCSGEPGRWWPAPWPSLLLPKLANAADVSLMINCAGLVVVLGSHLQPVEPR